MADDDLNLLDDDGGLGAAQNIDDLSLVGTDDDGLTEPTPDQIAARERAANDPGVLKAKIAKLEAEKVTAAKDIEIATLRGKLEAADEYGRRSPAVAAPAARVYTDAEMTAMNQKLVEELSTNPLAALQRVRELAKADALAEMQAASSPALGTAGQMVIENFLTRKSKGIEAKWYSMAEKEFHAETSSLDPGALLQLPVAERSKILDRFWQAAMGRVTEQMLSKRGTASPRSIGGAGGASGPSNQGGAPIKRLAAALGYTEMDALRFAKASFPKIADAQAVKLALDAVAS